MPRVSLVLAFVGSVAALSGQSPARSFDVVSVKRNTAASPQPGISPQGEQQQFRLTAYTLSGIIGYAYQMRPYQLIGIPGWADAERFDILGTYPAGADPRGQHREMLQQVLATRFQLKARRETREMPIFRLVVSRADGRLGPQLIPSSDVDCDRLIAEKRVVPGAGRPSVVTPNKQRTDCILVSNAFWISGGAQSIQALASALENRVGRTVVDATALAGKFDIEFGWSRDTDFSPGGTNIGPMLTAIEDQLGLKLESTRGPVEVLVIDSVERPTPD